MCPESVEHISCSALSISRRMWRARSATMLPSGVRRTPVELRSNNMPLNCSSSLQTMRERAGCEMAIFSAAPRIGPCIRHHKKLRQLMALVEHNCSSSWLGTACGQVQGSQPGDHELPSSSRPSSVHSGQLFMFPSIGTLGPHSELSQETIWCFVTGNNASFRSSGRLRLRNINKLRCCMSRRCRSLADLQAVTRPDCPQRMAPSSFNFPVDIAEEAFAALALLRMTPRPDSNSHSASRADSTSANALAAARRASKVSVRQTTCGNQTRSVTTFDIGHRLGTCRWRPEAHRR